MFSKLPSVSRVFIVTLALLSPTATADEPMSQEDITLTKLIESTQKTMRRFGSASAPDKQDHTFRLTTYNIENLFDDVDDPTLTGKNDDADEAKPHHQLLAAAYAIREIDSDVLCLQEIESLDALKWFRDKYLSDMGYEYVVSLDAGNSRGIENAVLSRFPLSEPELWIGKELGGVHPENYGRNKNFYAGEPVAFRRSPLKLDVNIPQIGEAEPWTLTLFVVHQKSGRYSQYWREAEAKMITKLAGEVDTEHEGRPIVILGDFNAQTSDKSVKTYFQAGFHDIFANATGIGDAIITHESERRIDLILANKAATDYLKVDTAFVYGTAARPEGISWRDLDTFEGYAADHYPVSVDVGW
jgi:endonuclease/exonuclease/phosphatase family metal-dependent hydrolase